MVYASCAYCHGFTYQLDWFPSLPWCVIECVICKAHYKIEYNPQTKKLETTDISIPCPKCGKFFFDSEWNKETRSYDSYCEHCHYTETRKGD